MRTLTIWLVFLLISTLTVAQDIRMIEQDHPLYQLESRLMKGDKSALFEIALYFDSKKKVIEFLGYHQLETSESAIARRVVAENSLFTDEEFKITASSTTKQFTDFLNKNNNNIVFSELATSFLITPLDKRTITFEIRALPEARKQELKDRAKALLSPEWVKKSKIDSFVKEKDPFSLLLIASELFKRRSRFNRYYFNKDELTQLLQYFTGTDFGVENEKGILSWHPDKDYYPSSQLNLLIYFSRFYSQYSWNDKDSGFTNPLQVIKPIGEEDQLFQLLNNKNDSIAIDAFIKLTICDPEKVAQLSYEYESADIARSYAIPIFPYKFLKQLVLLTTYCKTNKIDFTGSKELQNNISLLQSDLSFPERRKLEDKLINTLTLEDITAFEYWALIYEQSWELTYSTGRILDIFYSNHFSEILNSHQQLSLFFKKSVLFDNLGIIGVCNNYLTKFTNLQAYGTEKLNVLQTTDTEIKGQIEKAKVNCKLSIKSPNDPMKINNGNKDFVIKNIKQSIIALRKIKDQEKMERSLMELLSKINYNQIGDAMKGVEDIKLKNKWGTYSFLERDFGFFIYGDFDKKTTRQEFLTDYIKFSEFNFYRNMLAKARTNYFYDDNTLNYDKIFDALKYNVVAAFPGGGGGRLDNEVYAIIKLLELTHKTTLGYPKKLCNSKGVYGCDSQDRANYWMQYLAEKKLLKGVHNEPVSFHYE